MQIHATDPPPAVGRDWPCLKCGYNLKTLSPEGNCPECGLPVAQSLLAKPLAESDPCWLRQINRGLTALLILSMAWAILEFPGIARMLYLATSSFWSLFMGFGIGGWNAVEKLSYPLTLLPTAILWRRSETRGECPRWPGRFLLIVIVAHLLFLGWAIAVRLIWWGGWNSAYALASGIEPMFLVAEFWLLLRVIERLAVRIPGKPMLLEAGVLRRIFSLVLLMQAAAYCLLEFMQTRLWYALGGGHSFFTMSLIFSTPKTANYCLWPLWFYLPVFLLRFHLYARKV